MNQLGKATLAEFVGVFCFVFLGAGSVCTLVVDTGGGINIVAVALAHGLALAVVIASLARFSGGHINPAVTFALTMTGRCGPGRAAAYITAQLLGAAAAGAALKGLYPAVVAGAPAWLGLPGVAENMTVGQAVWLEGILTFVLVLAVFGTAVDPAGPKNLGPFAIGLTLAAAIVVAGPRTGAALNPARHFGPAIATGHWVNTWIYWVGPGLGALAAGWVYELLLLGRDPAKPRGKR
jgi:aquaporin Z